MAIAERAVRGFRDRWRREPSYVVAAPGRVNLIGEHTDYNGGPVLPIAIERHVVIAAARASRGSTVTRLYSTAFDEQVAIDPPPAEGAPAWARYPSAVLALCAEAGLRTGPLDCFIDSDVPIGAGLSSSAAIEVATATLAEAVAGRALDCMEKARICRRAEQEGAGVPCGIMDQAASACSRADHAMLLDCRDDRIDFVPFACEDVAILVTDTGARRRLDRVEYAERRRECHEAATALGAASLCDVTVAKVDAARHRLDATLFRRARHVVTEIARTREAAEALRRGDWLSLGRLMDASHDSLRDDFEVSSVELDALVEAARSISPAGGVFGSRLTGAGFGGSTVSLVERGRAEEILAQLSQAFRARVGREAPGFPVRPAAGARVLIAR